MPSQLPTSDTTNKAMKDFGVGTYDSPQQSEYNTEDEIEAKKSLPGMPSVLKDGDEIIGDSYAPTSDVRKLSSSGLPGDFDRAPKRKKGPNEDTIQAPVESVAVAELPREKDNPPAHSDYYDRSKVGGSSLPGDAKNEASLDKFLGSLGNWWSGFSFDDLAQPTSFPGADRPPEESDKYTSVPVGTVRKSREAMEKQATNLDLIGTLASDFMKKYGKKDLTRRHVMAFLQESGYHQYLASDVVRCLQQRHNIDISDVLDQFPVSKKTKTASMELVSDTMRHLISIRRSIASIRTKDRVALATLKKCGDGIMDVVADMARGLQDG